MILKIITHGRIESHSVPFGTPLTGMAIESVWITASDLADAPDPHTMTWTHKYGAYLEDLLSRIRNSRYAKHRKPHVPAHRAERPSQAPSEPVWVSPPEPSGPVSISLGPDVS